MNSILHYFTHIIVNPSTNAEKWSNIFLIPFQICASTVWNKKIIQYYKINYEKSRVEEIDSELLLSDRTLLKIIKLSVYSLLAIPGLLISSCLLLYAKKDSQFEKSHTFLKEWLKNKDIKTFKQVIPDVPNDCFLMILSFLSVQKQVSLRVLNNAAKDLISNSPLLLKECRKRLHGIPKETTDHSLTNLIGDCLKHKDHVNYSKQLINSFGGLTNLLEIPLYQNSKENSLNLDYTTVIKTIFAQFDSLPDIFRFRIKLGDKLTMESCTFHTINGQFMEIFLVKYSQFIPKEFLKNSTEDIVWKGFFVLDIELQVTTKETIRISRDSKCDPLLKTIQSFNNILRNDISSNNLGWINNTRPFLDTNCTKSFLNRNLCNYLETTLESIQGSSYPDCLKKGKVYLDLPYKLGHISIDEMKKSLVSISIPDFIVDSCGKTIKNPYKKSNDPQEVWTFSPAKTKLFS